MFENPRRGRQTRNFTTNVQKILDLKSPSEQIFSENCLWVPLLRINLQINLAVADLLIGFTEPVTIGTYGILLFYSDLAENTQYGNVSTAFKPCSLPLLYVVCLVLIFLERAFTLICPFRHRVTITRSYIHSIIFAWFTGITLGTFSLLAVNGIVDFTHWIVAWPIAVF